jgi:NAD(P)-dependent dehydrogenase (short-subunit alcohol dehydrogenase family)
MSQIGDFPLKNKIAVVTGGGSGINLCFVQLAVQQGAKVIIADLRLTEEAQKFINGSTANSVIFEKCDVTKRADLENLIKVSEEKYGDIPDVYIAGAGVFEPVYLPFPRTLLLPGPGTNRVTGMVQFLGRHRRRPLRRTRYQRHPRHQTHSYSSPCSPSQEQERSDSHHGFHSGIPGDF